MSSTDVRGDDIGGDGGSKLSSGVASAVLFDTALVIGGVIVDSKKKWKLPIKATTLQTKTE